VARVGEKRDAYVVFMWRHTRNERLGRFRRKWEDSIKTGLDWTDLAAERDKWRTVLNLRVP